MEKLRALYKAQRSPEAAATFQEAIHDLMVALLQSPEFLYHWQLGPNAPIRDGRLIRFNAHEIASRLSYLFWASMPDDTLLAAADAGKLSSPEEIAREARRLLADDRAKDAVKDFHWQWLEVGGLDDSLKDPVFKDYTPQLVRSMLNESKEFAASVFFGPQADGKLETLLTSNATFLDVGLARLYGLPAPAGAGLQPARLPSTERAGIFTRAAFLAVNADPEESNPVDRGTVILRRLFCLDLREPDNIAIPVVADPGPNATTRERFEAHGKMPCAVACHDALIDQIGYAFENYDAIGAYRTTDQGKPVNARASFAVRPGTEFKSDNAVELMGLLARSDDVRACMTTQWLRYFLRRKEVQTETPTLEALGLLFRDSGHDLRELMVGLARTRTFTHRTLTPGEVTP